MRRIRNNNAGLQPIRPDFITTRSELDALTERITNLQRIVDILRTNCGEYKRDIAVLKEAFKQTPSAIGGGLKPSPIERVTNG